MDEQQVATQPTAAVDLFEGLETKTLANEGVEIEIMRADGESSGLWIRVLGADSEQAVRHREKQERQRIRALSKGGRAALDGLYDTGKAAEMELTIACCLGWRHVSGQPMPFQIGSDEEDKSKKFFKDFPLVYDQVRVGINDRAHFTKGSAKP